MVRRNRGFAVPALSPEKDVGEDREQIENGEDMVARRASAPLLGHIALFPDPGDERRSEASEYRAEDSEIKQ